MNTIDIIVFISYGLLIIGVGLWVSRKKGGIEKTTEDYFLASKSLPWWAIGASLIAANISAEQFIAMSGSGYAIGLGIASYEWMGGITLLLVGKFFLPIFLEKKIYTMPQFLEMRFDSRVRTSFAMFWLLVYVFVNLTSVLYLGALSLKIIMGIPMWYGLIGLAFVAAVYSIYGGLAAVVWTDVVQVVFLIIGGLVTTYFALDALPGSEGFIGGMKQLIREVPGKFDMILSSDHEAFDRLPGISVLIGGMWIMNISYWGLNQYITQRAFAAKSIKEAQRGVLFAAYLKILIPLIVVIPGIAAFALHADLAKADQAYPWVLNNFVPTGLKGLAFAALAAAIVSSLGSMINSTATIFTIDIYKRFLDKEATNMQMVKMGRIASLTALTIAVFTARPLLGSLDEAFQFIQEFTGFVTPAVVSIFMLGLFWKRTTANAAFWSAIVTIPLSAGFKYFWPELPFMDRMGVVFLIITGIAVTISLVESQTAHPKSIEIRKGVFHTGPAFNIGAIGMSSIVAVLYLLFW